MDLVGIDEVGRGPWAGPLVAAAVLLKSPIAGLNDSKKLSEPQRIDLAHQIQRNSQAIGIGWVHAREIDKLGLTVSTSRAMVAAVAMLGDLTNEKDILIDGNFNYLPHNERSKFMIKADGKVEAVSAASIIAKVMRDRFMRLMSQKYPNYGFENHVGYGTKAHSEAIQKLGLTPLHRRSFKPIQLLAVGDV